MNDDSRTLSFDAGRSLRIEAPPRPLPKLVANADDLALWHQERELAAAEVDALERERRRMLASTSVEAIRAQDDAIATARVRAERAAAVIEDAETKFAERAERVRAAQPDRRRRHAAAVKARAEAERIVREVYGPAAATIAAALVKLGDLQAVVDAATEPPEGEARVPDCEAFRHPPEAGCRTYEPLARAVVLPPVIRSEPALWPTRG